VFSATTGRSAVEAEPSTDSLLLSPGLNWDPQHLVLRRDSNGYDGVIDTYISRDTDPETPRGGETNVHCKESGWGLKWALIRFDLAEEIPYYMQVNSATLDLRVAHAYGTGDMSVSVYRLNSDWDEMATWSELGSDCYDATPVVRHTFQQTTSYGSIDITDLVQGWVTDPLSNHGLLIKSGSTVDLRFYSSEEGSQDRRPRLVVDYEIPQGVTPPPTLTPTFTPTLTPAPTSTPTPEAVITSYGKYQAFGGECVETFIDSPGVTQVLLLTRGTVDQARLEAWHQNNNGYDTLQVNGQVVGTLLEQNGREKCTGRENGTQITIELDPGIIVEGLNTITALTDAEWENDWSLESPSIIVGGALQSADIRQIQVTSSYDENEQRSTVMLPIDHDPMSAEAYPLVVVLHGWGGDDFEALKWMAQACNERGWVLAAPWIRSGSDHTASLGAQHDIVDLIDHLESNQVTYNIDPDRVYLVGRSMGAMIAATTACKYPDRFAALVEWQGPTDLAAWYTYLESDPHQLSKILAIEKDCGGAPTAAYYFDYQRRSAASMPMNLSNVPTMIVHGDADTMVPVAHAENLYAGMLPYGPVYVDKFIYSGDHYAPDPPPLWDADHILAFFSQYERTTVPEHVQIRTDEPKSYYWLSLEYDNEIAPHWNLIDARYDRLGRYVELDVRDERSNPRASYILLDLLQLGLPITGDYTVEDQNLDTGAYTQSTVSPAGGSLRIRVGADHHRLTVYPYVGETPDQLSLVHGNAGYSGVWDTTIESNPPGDNHGSEDSLRIATSGTLARLLIRFDLLGQIPTGQTIKGAQLKLRTNYSWGGNRTVRTSAYRLLEPWDPLQANWNERLTGVSWHSNGASEMEGDFASSAYAGQTLEADNVTYVYNVTDLVQEWVAGQYPNYGILIKGESGSATYKINASESASYQPELQVWFDEPTVTPTITPSPTPTVNWSLAFLPAIIK